MALRNIRLQQILPVELCWSENGILEGDRFDKFKQI